MGTQSRVGRPRKRTLRVELRLNADHPATRALMQEAATHHVSLQQHIADMLIARHMHQGMPQIEPAQPADAAAALANEWM